MNGHTNVVNIRMSECYAAVNRAKSCERILSGTHQRMAKMQADYGVDASIAVTTIENFTTPKRSVSKWKVAITKVFNH